MNGTRELRLQVPLLSGRIMSCKHCTISARVDSPRDEILHVNVPCVHTTYKTAYKQTAFLYKSPWIHTRCIYFKKMRIRSTQVAHRAPLLIMKATFYVYGLFIIIFIIISGFLKGGFYFRLALRSSPALSFCSGAQCFDLLDFVLSRQV